MPLQSTTIGDFAGTALDGVMPPDDASKLPINTPEPKKEEAKKETVVDKTTIEKESVATEEAEVDKKDDLLNPNLDAAKPKVIAADSDEVPKGMTGKAAETWKAIKTENRTMAKQAEETKAELERVRAEVAEFDKAKATLDAMRKELEMAKEMVASYEGEINVTRVEGTKKWKENVSAPQKDISDAIVELGKRYEVAPEDLLRAIQEPDPKKRAELLSQHVTDFNEMDKLEVAQAARDWQKTLRIASGMREDAGKQLEELTKAERAEIEQQSARISQDYVRAVGSEWDNTTAKFPWIRKSEDPKFAGWNAHVDELKRTAESINVNEIPVNEVAQMKVAALILPDLHRSLEHLQNQNKIEKDRADAAEKKIAEWKKTQPGAGGGNRSDTTTSNGKSEWKFADVTVGR